MSLDTCVRWGNELHPNFTEADVVWRAKHRPGDWRTFTGGPFCLECKKEWPCIPAIEHEAVYHLRDEPDAEAQRQARFRAIMPSESTLFSPYAWPHIMLSRAKARGDERAVAIWQEAIR